MSKARAVNIPRSKSWLVVWDRYAEIVDAPTKAQAIKLARQRYQVKPRTKMRAHGRRNPGTLQDALAQKAKEKRARFNKLLMDAERELDKAVNAKSLRAIETAQRRIKDIRRILKRL